MDQPTVNNNCDDQANKINIVINLTESAWISGCPDNCLGGKLPPDNCAPDNCPLDNCPPDYCLPDNCLRGKLPQG